MKLNPPSLESIVPAFSGDVLKIPFNINRTVGMSQVGGMSLLVKTV